LLLSRDGKTLYSASFDAINVWEVPTLKKKASLGPPGSDVRGMVLSHDGQMLAVTCGAAGPEDQLWGLKAGKLKLALGGSGGVQLWSLAFTGDGKGLVSNGYNSTVRFWDAATGHNTRLLPLEIEGRTPIALSPDGKMIAAGDGAVVRLFDATTGKHLFDLKGHTSTVRALAFSPDGKQLASASGNRVSPKEKRLSEPEPGEAIVWGLATRNARFACKRHSLGTYAVTWSPDGKQIATAGPADPNTFGVKVDADRAVNLWDARTGKQVEEFSVRAKDGVTEVSFSPDGKYLLAAGFLLDARTGKELRRFHGSAFAFSKDSKAVVAVGGGAIEVWSPDTGKRLGWHTPKGAPSFNAVAFHPDGKSVAAAGSNGVIWMWDIAPGKK
jgi:WD40 repeat protein